MKGYHQGQDQDQEQCQDKYKGQHLYIKKVGGSYTHHGIGIGNNRVIHYSGMADDFTTAGVIEEITLEDFAKDNQIFIKPHLDRQYNPDQAILRACLRLGEAQYHILHNNCEHFVEWSINGKHRSYQSRRGKLLYSAGMGARALIGANPVSFIAGAAAGYAYINHQGLKKLPDFQSLEAEYERIISARKKLQLFPYSDNT